MSKRNSLTQAPPYEVEQALKRIGADLRTSRLARNLSIDAVAAKLGVGYRAVASAEAGKPTTAIGVYLAVLWAYGLIDQVHEFADPTRDELVQRAARARTKAHPSRKRALDNDF